LKPISGRRMARKDKAYSADFLPRADSASEQRDDIKQ
jgi:hypothetical protein